jgi:hypothetical protein
VAIVLKDWIFVQYFLQAWCDTWRLIFLKLGVSWDCQNCHRKVLRSTTSAGRRPLMRILIAEDDQVLADGLLRA